MSFELTGKLLEKFETEQPSPTFRKREFVIETAEERNGRKFFDPIKFQLIQDRVDLIDNYDTGEEIKVSFDIKGNRWERDGRVSYFTNLVAWRIEKAAEGGAPPPSDPGAGAPPPSEAPPEKFEDGYEDDLPF